MTKGKLESYRSNTAEVRELRYKLYNLPGNEELIGNSVVMDYRNGYPKPQSVVGYDLDLEQKRREKWTARLEKLQDEILEVETWIENISDSLTRRIYRMWYVDGMTQRQIAKRVHMSQAAVSKKISAILKME